MENKETLKEVPKVWGREVWIVNCDKYCSKFLHLNKDARSSLHMHPTKQETFLALEGQVSLTIEGRDYMLNPFSRPKTIYPGQKHSFWGITAAKILEISTHHSEEDTVRFTNSKGAPK